MTQTELFLLPFIFAYIFLFSFEREQQREGSLKHRHAIGNLKVLPHAEWHQLSVMTICGLIMAQGIMGLHISFLITTVT